MTQHGHSPSHGAPHALPLWLLFGVWIALLILTYITVTATSINLGDLNIWIAIGIATVKASLVALYFMHLRYDHPFNGFVFVVSLVFVALFLGFALTDTLTYHPDIIPGYAPGVQK